MRILMVISQFHPIVGGAENQAFLLSRKLQEGGHQVTVVTGWWIRGTPRKEMIHHIPVVRNFCIWGISGPKWRRPMAALAYMVTLFFHLVKQRKEYDIVHIHQALYPAFTGILAAKLLKKPAVVKVGCSGEWGDVRMMTGGRIPFGRLMLRMIQHCDRIIATNRDMVVELKESGFPQKRIVPIPNGVIPKARKENHGRAFPGVTSLVYVGRLSEQKGVDVLFRAIKKIEKKEVVLHILGEGPEFKNLESITQDPALRGKVEFHGNVSNVWSYLTRSDIFVLPSRSEGMSNSLLEAMSVALPSIVSHIPGNIDLIHEDPHTPPPIRGDFKIGNGGLTVRVGDPEGLARAIETLMKDPSLRQKLGQEAERIIQSQYAMDSVAYRYSRLYGSLVSCEKT